MLVSIDKVPNNVVSSCELTSGAVGARTIWRIQTAFAEHLAPFGMSILIEIQSASKKCIDCLKDDNFVHTKLTEEVKGSCKSL